MDQPPRVPVKLHRNGINLVVEDCPYCHGRHLHGIGKGLSANGDYGPRLAHCCDPKAREICSPGYVLIPYHPSHAEHEETLESTRRRKLDAQSVNH